MSVHKEVMELKNLSNEGIYIKDMFSLPSLLKACYLKTEFSIV